jgi:hypothetical protein
VCSFGVDKTRGAQLRDAFIFSLDGGQSFPKFFLHKISSQPRGVERLTALCSNMPCSGFIRV